MLVPSLVDASLAPVGKHVAKSLMYQRVVEEMEATRAAIAALEIMQRDSGV